MVPLGTECSRVLTRARVFPKATHLLDGLARNRPWAWGMEEVRLELPLRLSAKLKMIIVRDRFCFGRNLEMLATHAWGWPEITRPINHLAKRRIAVLGGGIWEVRQSPTRLDMRVEDWTFEKGDRTWTQYVQDSRDHALERASAFHRLASPACLYSLVFADKHLYFALLHRDEYPPLMEQTVPSPACIAHHLGVLADLLDDVGEGTWASKLGHIREQVHSLDAADQDGWRSLLTWVMESLFGEKDSLAVLRLPCGEAGDPSIRRREITMDNAVGQVYYCIQELRIRLSISSDHDGAGVSEMVRSGRRLP